ncbi:anaerobic ribonucleoside-triphosphate reductase activating protein [Lentilactobacillus hilgardii]|uniref:Anaerobic ribonucleoside-triphosphate reductase-activating protein n=1 Tax=Lentilactobacillus hilgardii (strain ATCC 8290 / DSM 20176 / CCUG 30140 / JCM 1155 / KCTC 3500 / NBRC 15886 / NCIMB 8040 / NRRL B-1843 / 9) TaxID=1423757 RepID=C0XIT8_LENH9|nr:anaerobic ribonucleoside-triphosphate reductase activating protein [Lentilactobacillus hilgardii]EEI20837.1 anaerobic ribonucleoside-triphosphate reductase activating protein [Lentilactobacillus buchneri ATCC 11577]EEI24749.1 anaerobic ribonucleoside-triphosphate reductase activating protein [Lentilactobacillus hilgardii DSM 20176 = ATCC 8290]KRK57586.1 ribonucleoside-triphosphate reductase class III activase subunit [Lentilactobacillus hilgardii DSM 20176 = ATCC 8290]MCP9333501.1 anaerobic 
MAETRKIRLPNDPKPKQWLAKDRSHQYIASYKPFNMVDGEGVRCSLYVSGCLFNCPGCYNKVAQNFHYGHPYTKELENQIIKDMSESYVQGLTLLGGEPFLNTQVCIKLAKRIRAEFGHTKDIWSWTGYKWDELMKESDDKLELLSYLDILVDGRFLLAKKDLTLQFRGSSNQRIIDVPKSLAEKKVMIWEKLVK